MPALPSKNMGASTPPQFRPHSIQARTTLDGHILSRDSRLECYGAIGGLGFCMEPSPGSLWKVPSSFATITMRKGTKRHGHDAGERVRYLEPNTQRA